MESDKQIEQGIRKVMYRASTGQHPSRVAVAANELVEAVNDGRREAVAKAFEEAVEELKGLGPLSPDETNRWLLGQATKFRAEIAG